MLRRQLLTGLLMTVALTVLLGLERVGGYLARWDQMDLTDPTRPRISCPVDELRRP